MTDHLIIDRYHQDRASTVVLRDTYIRRLYKVHSWNSEYVPLDGDHPITEYLQRKQVDAICVSHKTKLPVYMEEKYDFHVPNNFCLETVSNTTTAPERPGWMRTAESHCLVYSFVWIKDVLDVFLLDFVQLRAWFWKELEHHPEWKTWKVPNSPNHTQSLLVSVKQVVSHVRTHRYLVTADGSVIPAHPLDLAREVLEFHGLSFEPIVKDHLTDVSKMMDLEYAS